MALLDQVETIVIVMMENRSFDHLLGYLCLPKYDSRTDVDGLVNPDTDPRFANVWDHQIYRPFEMDDGPFLHDLPHARDEVAIQLALEGADPTMTGFVEAYVKSTHSIVQNPPPLGYLAPKSIPITSFLAKKFLVCDHWFAPLPADTQPNRAVAFTGSSLVDDTKGRIIPYRDGCLVLEKLSKWGVNWRVYHSGLSFFLLFGAVEHALGDNFQSLTELAGDFHDPQVKPPQVVFVEPEYDDSPVHMGFAPNDNHPPLPIGPGEEFVRQVYSIVAGSPHWPSTMLVVTYDEHGGFFDHALPRKIASPPPPGALYTRSFATTGVRVPALIASPFVAGGACYSGLLDHTSILQALAEKFAGGTGNYSEDVTHRAGQGIESLSKVLRAPPGALPKPPAAPVAPIEVTSRVLRATKPLLTENQKAFALAARKLLEHDPVRAVRKFPELVHLPKTP